MPVSFEEAGLRAFGGTPRTGAFLVHLLDDRGTSDESVFPADFPTFLSYNSSFPAVHPRLKLVQAEQNLPPSVQFMIPDAQLVLRFWSQCI